MEPRRCDVCGAVLPVTERTSYCVDCRTAWKRDQDARRAAIEASEPGSRIHTNLPNGRQIIVAVVLRWTLDKDGSWWPGPWYPPTWDTRA